MQYYTSWVTTQRWNFQNKNLANCSETATLSKQKQKTAGTLTWKFKIFTVVNEEGKLHDVMRTSEKLKLTPSISSSVVIQDATDHALVWMKFDFWMPVNAFANFRFQIAMLRALTWILRAKKQIKNSKFTEAMHWINVSSVSLVTIRARTITISKITLKINELWGWIRGKTEKQILFFDLSAVFFWHCYLRL